jgi:hypothetical protein
LPRYDAWLDSRAHGAIEPYFGDSLARELRQVTVGVPMRLITSPVGARLALRRLRRSAKSEDAK